MFDSCNGVVSHSVGIKGTCSPSSHFFMCRPNSSSCGLSFRVAAGGVPRVGPRYFFGLRRTTGRRFCDASAAWRAARSVAVAKCADDIVVQGNLANTYESLGRPEKALTMQRDVYSGRLKLNGEEHPITLRAADNYAITLGNLQRYAESKAVLRKIMPLARRVLGESHELTLTMRQNYGAVLCNNPGATLDDTREAVTTLEESERVARHVYGGAHPLASGIEHALRNARAALRARETPPPRSA